MWNLKNKRKEKRGEKEGGKPRNRLLTVKNKLIITIRDVGGGWFKWVMVIKGCTGCDKQWVMYGSAESRMYT